MKKLSILAFVVVLLPALLTACGGDDGEATLQPTPTPTAAPCEAELLCSVTGGKGRLDSEIDFVLLSKNESDDLSVYCEGSDVEVRNLLDDNGTVIVLGDGITIWEYDVPGGESFTTYYLTISLEKGDAGNLSVALAEDPDPLTAGKRVNIVYYWVHLEYKDGEFTLLDAI